MRFFVENGEVVASADASVELSVCNPLFRSEGSGTLSVDVPLDVAENRRVFGPVGRVDVAKPVEWLDCTAVAGGRVLRGALAVTEVSQLGLKVQFVEGVRWYGDDWEAPVDSVYVNELDLGRAPVTDPFKISPLLARRGVGDAVCLPWLAMGTDVVFNLAVSPEVWHEDTARLVWQRSLLGICEDIAAAVEYVLVIPDVVRGVWGDALVCNSLPPSWELPGFARALPRWTVREWFEKLGPLMRGVFEFDDSGRRIVFLSYEDVLDRAGVWEPEVIDDYSCVVARDEEDADFGPVLRRRYRSQDVTVWKYLDAPWLRDSAWSVTVRETVDDLLKGGFETDDRGHRVNGGGPLYYCREVDTYFVYRGYTIYSEGRTSKHNSDKYPYAHLGELQPVDVFGPDYWKRDEDTEYDVLDFCPVCVDWALEGRVMWLPVGEISEADGKRFDSLDVGILDDRVSLGHGVVLSNGVILSDSSVRGQTRLEAAIECYDEDEGERGYFDCVFVGFRNPDVDGSPFPLVDYVMDGGELRGGPRMRLRGVSGDLRIDPRVKYSFSFVSDVLPDWRGVFVFHGQRFLCRELRAEFRNGALVGLVRGDFYRLLGDGEG